MGSFFDKQHSSRLGKAQGVTWAGTGTGFSTNFGPETWQIRVVTQTAGYVAVVATTADTSIPTTAVSTSVVAALLPANLPEYFTVNPGMILAFASTTTSTVPTPIVNVVEMS